MPPDYAFVAGDQGVHNFGVTPLSAGTLTVTATDTVTASITASAALPIVTDPPLTPRGRTIRIFGGSVPVLVASFTDADLSENGSNLSATINWGDGTTTANVVPIRVGNTNVFHVIGSHAYKIRGTFVVTVTMNDAAGATAVANSTAQFLPRTFSY